MIMGERSMVLRDNQTLDSMHRMYVEKNGVSNGAKRRFDMSLGPVDCFFLL